MIESITRVENKNLSATYFTVFNKCYASPKLHVSHDKHLTVSLLSIRSESLPYRRCSIEIYQAGHGGIYL
jgi:hypothetical protein